MSCGFESAAAPPSPQPVESRELDVHGERWRVSLRDDWAWDYEWLTGPNPYGFTSSGGQRRDIDDPSHEQAIRRFAAEIDPKTGYLRE